MRSEHFQYPEAAFLFIFTIIFFVLFWLLSIYRNKRLQNLKKEIIYERPLMHYWRKVAYFLLAWVFAVIALMDPIGNIHYEENQDSNHSKIFHDVIFILDTSQSMDVKDMRGKSRLEYAKEIADEIIRGLKGQNIGIYTFTSELTLTTPVTPDYIFSRISLKNVDINQEGIAGTDFYKTLDQLTKEIHTNHPVTIIFLSDGGDLNYENESKDLKQKRIQEMIQILEKEALHHVSIFTIGIGSKEGGEIPEIKKNNKTVNSKLIPDLLELIASKKNGKYYFAYDLSSEQISKDIHKKIQTSFNEKKSILFHEETKVFDRYYQRTLALSIFFLALYILIPENWKNEKIR